MRKCERAATRDLGIPVSLLMEHAGFAVVRAMERRYGTIRGKSVIVVCGKGNNGGDGLVAARGLLSLGARVIVLLCAPFSELRPLPKMQAMRFRRLVDASGPGSTGSILELSSTRNLSVLPKPDFIIDALFGTGFSAKPRGLPARAIKWMNTTGATTIAVDVPSGLDADSGEARGDVVQAEHTVTFQAIKPGLLICEGRTYAGYIEAVDIGIAEPLVRHYARTIRLADSTGVCDSLPKRSRTAHKHSVGKVLMIAGSVGFAGAAAMAAQAAMRSGAGSVILISPKSLYTVLSRKLTEVMVVPADETNLGTLSDTSWNVIERHLEWADVVGVGPGLSRNNQTVGIIHSIIRRTPSKLLLDADGINAFSGSMDLLRLRKRGDLILTPHVGEFARLTGETAGAIERNRLVLARAHAKRLRAVIVLKGAPTVSAAPSGMLTLNDTGNPGMATAGAGDILTGLLAGLWAQGMGAEDAASASVYLHGLAGDFARDRLGERSLLALDILEELPAAFLAVGRGEQPHDQ